MTALRDLEAVVLWKERVFLVAARLRQCRRIFFVIYIRDALEKEQREDVSLEVGSIHRAAEDIGGFPKVGFEHVQRCNVIRHEVAGLPLGQTQRHDLEARTISFHLTTLQNSQNMTELT